MDEAPAFRRAEFGLSIGRSLLVVSPFVRESEILPSRSDDLHAAFSSLTGR